MQYQDSGEPSGVGDDSPSGGSNVARARDRKAHAAMQLRKTGASWDEIAEVIGYPTARAALVSVERTLEKDLLTDEGKKFMRRLASERLDRLLRGVWTKAIDPGNPDHLQAVDRARQLIDRHARLHGLDAPTEHIVHSPTQMELEKWVSEVISASRPALDEADIFEAEILYDSEDPGDGNALPA
jgi:hypothetical protein